MWTLFALFLIIFLGVLFGAHYFVYFSLVKFFAVESGKIKILLVLILLFLSLSYFLASFLGRMQENLLTRSFYIFSANWLGFLTDFVLAFAVAWIIILLGKIFNFPIDRLWLGIIFIILASALSGWGIWNAMHPRIKNISVTIPNLPENWKGQKIVQLSDIHIGHVYRTNFMEKLVSDANGQNPKMVVITGDLFDGMNGNLKEPAQVLKKLRTDKVYFITGNHETYLGVDKAEKNLENTKVKILNDEVVDVDGLKVIGINYPERSLKTNILEKLKKLQPQFQSQPNIFLYHSPVNIPEVAAAGVNLQLSGHTHVGQMFPFKIITSLVYKGYDYGLHKIGDYTLYTTNGIGTWGPTIRTFNTPEIVVITLN